MYKLFLIIYSASGAIGGTVGPLDGPEAAATCEAYLVDARQKMAARPDLPQLRFECEWWVERPKVTEHL